MKHEVERRYTKGALELRAASSPGSVGTLVGYAAKYNKYSSNLGGFVERVLPGAFDKSLADRLDVMCRYNHADEFLLGRTTSGTLTLRSDATGLQYTNELPDTSMGRDMAVLTKRGDITQSSFAFYIPEGGDVWSTTEQGFPLRDLVTTILVDVAPVNVPAYPDATVAIRSLAGALGCAPEEVVDLSKRNEIAKRLMQPTVIAVNGLSGRSVSTPTATAEVPEPAEDESITVNVEINVNAPDEDECDECGTEPCSCDTETVEPLAEALAPQVASEARKRTLMLLSLRSAA